MKIGFISLGCAKNQVDSEYLMGIFEDPHFELETDPYKCDVILINTCGFIESAKEEAINTILEMAELKKQNLKYLICTGCLVQRYINELKNELPEVDLFITIKDYPKANELLSELFGFRIDNSYGRNRTLISKNYTAYLRIADGCTNRCAYCAIPLIRGNCVSVPMEKIIEEAKRLHDQGVKELNIVAQDTTFYGYDLYNEFRLKDLIRELDRLDFKWIRILYMYPDEIEDELLDVIKESKHVLPYFDIPVQYGNDYILKLMNRRGSTAHIKERIRKIREMFPDAYIRTTMIVGFPHENEKTFDDTLKFIEDIRFDSLGAFTYSKEEDTAAYDMDEEVPEEVMNERLDILMKKQKEIVSDKLQNRIGEVHEALMEKKDRNFYYLRGYMSAPDGVDSYILVKSDKELKEGEFYKVKLTDYVDYDMIGEII